MAALAAIGSLSRDESIPDDDSISRLNHRVAYGIAMILALAVGSKQYVGDPVSCWIPKHFKKEWYLGYVHNYCWIKPMYKVPITEPIPSDEDERYNTVVGFYRWVVVYFALQALLFKLPRVVWQMAKSQSGVNVENIVTMTMDTAMEDPDTRNEQLGHVAEFLHRWVVTRRRPLHKGRGNVVRNKVDAMWKRSGHFLVALFLTIKVLYLVVALVQFQIVSMFLDVNFWTFGPRALGYPLLSRSVARHSGAGHWLTTEVFPRVAYCDFQIRQMTNVQTHTVQCVLSINLFLEKMYLLLWFLLLLLVLANLYSLVTWTIDLLTDCKTAAFLDKFCHVITPGKSARNSELRLFNSLARGYLMRDGIFLIKIIASNTTDLLAADLLRQIWVRYKKYRKNIDGADLLPDEPGDTSGRNNAHNDGIVNANDGAAAL